MGEKLSVNWRYFSLEQINSERGPEWKIWEQSEGYPSRGLLAFQAAEAARRQGNSSFDSFHIALLKARHEQSKDIADVDVLNQIAESVNLEMAQFQKDFNVRKLLAKLAGDHTFAVKVLGIFGTPTLVFPEKQAIFLKMTPPLAEDSLSVFKDVRTLVECGQYIQEIKRLQSPSK
jgi:predicted DsbA family dithiol-disulfide isomerase